MKPISTFKMLAYIREAECIGCAKCIQACPFDAIIGAPREMHTVLANECIGCDLCIPACPVDCIDRIPIELSNEEQQNRLQHARNRHHARKQRLINKSTHQSLHNIHDHVIKTNYVLEAIKRNKSKKQT